MDDLEKEFKKAKYKYRRRHAVKNLLGALGH
jgi:hypothetical protein